MVHLRHSVKLTNEVIRIEAKPEDGSSVGPRLDRVWISHAGPLKDGRPATVDELMVAGHGGFIENESAGAEERLLAHPSARVRTQSIARFALPCSMSRTTSRGGHPNPL